MKEIPLTQGKVALVDDEDYEKFKNYKWNALRCGDGKTKFYADRAVWDKISKKVYHIKLHRLIMGEPKGLTVDHIDGNTLNNQKYNLRICTKQQNIMNRGINKNKKFKYKGVYAYNTKNGIMFLAQIKRPEKSYACSFSNAKSAAKWYDETLIKIFGKFAKTNKMLGLLD